MRTWMYRKLLVNKFKLLQFLSLCALSTSALSDAEVSYGQADISETDNLIKVNQSSKLASINWSALNLNKEQSLTFKVPTQDSITLNRITANEPTSIAGTIHSNGKLILLTKNDLIFSDTANVHAYSLLASSLALADDDFIAGNYKLQSQANPANIINQGNLTAEQNLTVVANFTNQGQVVAKLGNVQIASIDTATIDFNGDGLIQFALTDLDKLPEQAINHNINLKGLITTQNGGAINIIAANGKIEVDGKLSASHPTHPGDIHLTANNIVFLPSSHICTDNEEIGDGGELLALAKDSLAVAGKLTALGGPDGGAGGFIETSAQQLDISESASVLANNRAKNDLAGVWYTDPTDITLDSTSWTAYQNSLNNGTNVEIATIATGSENGDITLATNLSWTTNAKLSLYAHNNVNFGSYTITNAADGTEVLIRADSNGSCNPSSGSCGRITFNPSIGKAILSGANSKLIMQYRPAYDGGGGTDLDIASAINFAANGFSAATMEDYLLITNKAELDAVVGLNTSSTNNFHNYALGNNLDLGVEPNYTGIGAVDKKFNKIFDGNGYTINNLNITSGDNRGLFNYTSGATIKNLNLEQPNITCGTRCGALIGDIHNSNLENIKLNNGTISSNSYSVGGLIGGKGSGYAWDVYNANKNSCLYDGNCVYDDIVNIDNIDIINTTVASTYLAAEKKYRGLGILAGDLDSNNTITNVRIVDSKALNNDLNLSTGMIGTLLRYNTISNVSLSSHDPDEVNLEGYNTGGIVGLILRNYNISNITSKNITANTVQSAGGVLGYIMDGTTGEVIKDITIDKYSSKMLGKDDTWGTIYAGGVVGLCNLYTLFENINILNTDITFAVKKYSIYSSPYWQSLMGGVIGYSGYEITLKNLLVDNVYVGYEEIGDAVPSPYYMWHSGVAGVTLSGINASNINLNNVTIDIWGQSNPYSFNSYEKPIAGGIVANLNRFDTITNNSDFNNININNLTINDYTNLNTETAVGGVVGMQINSDLAAYSDIQIENLTINAAALLPPAANWDTQDFIYGGLIGESNNNTTIKNITLNNLNLTGTKVGGMVGKAVDTINIEHANLHDLTLQLKETSTYNYSITQDSVKVLGGLIGVYEDTTGNSNIKDVYLNKISLKDPNTDVANNYQYASLSAGLIGKYNKNSSNDNLISGVTLNNLNIYNYYTEPFDTGLAFYLTLHSGGGITRVKDTHLLNTHLDLSDPQLISDSVSFVNGSGNADVHIENCFIQNLSATTNSQIPGSNEFGNTPTISNSKVI